jgi:hypothetical protein
MNALFLAEGGQRHHLDLGVARADLASRLDAVERLHLEVHDDYVGSPPFGGQAGEQLQCLRAALGVADDQLGRKPGTADPLPWLKQSTQGAIGGGSSCSALTGFVARSQ